MRISEIWGTFLGVLLEGSPTIWGTLFRNLGNLIGVLFIRESYYLGDSMKAPLSSYTPQWPSSALKPTLQSDARREPEKGSLLLLPYRTPPYMILVSVYMYACIHVYMFFDVSGIGSRPKSDTLSLEPPTLSPKPETLNS